MEWLAVFTIEHYLRIKGHDIGVAASLEHLTATGVEKLWRVPECFIRGFFQKEFWELIVPTTGAAAFKLPKVIGYR